MADVVLYLNPEAFDTTGPALMGRHSAGESFLRGYLKHSRAPRFRFWNVAGQGRAVLDDLVGRIWRVDRPVDWINQHDRAGLAAVGAVHYPTPNLAREAWLRRSQLTPAAYGVSGLTHTTAEHQIMDSLSDLAMAPVTPWDALICTSEAVRQATESQIEAVRADLRERLGATRLPRPEVVTIPLGLNVDDFARDAPARRQWRTKLDLPSEAIVVLYVGRFNAKAKMNPVPMALALERAARLTDRPLVWLVAGWGEDYHAQVQAFCPSVRYVHVDGRRPENRFSVWSAADIFLSLSDNVQETFGLTPLEAMAAGVPAVVSDWNGYRDTVRDGVDGYRIPTLAPPPGATQDLADRYASLTIGYNEYVGAASQLVAVDVDATARAIAELADDDDRRRTMGAAARRRAREVFDWASIIPRYESLWDEMNARRRAALAAGDVGGSGPNPRRPDPFTLFAAYPSDILRDDVRVGPGADPAHTFDHLLRAPVATHGGRMLPSVTELRELAAAAAAGPVPVSQLLAAQPPERQALMARGLLFLAKYGLLTLTPMR